jgi:hypothetical protein
LYDQRKKFFVAPFHTFDCDTFFPLQSCTIAKSNALTTRQATAERKRILRHLGCFYLFLEFARLASAALEGVTEQLRSLKSCFLLPPCLGHANVFCLLTSFSFFGNRLNCTLTQFASWTFVGKAQHSSILQRATLNRNHYTNQTRNTREREILRHHEDDKYGTTQRLLQSL